MNDLISRQAAIDALQKETDAVCDDLYEIEGSMNICDMVRSISSVLDDLPSAQPEIIRCKDCIKREYCRTVTVWAIPPEDDWYCADAERRTDERSNKQDGGD